MGVWSTIKDGASSAASDITGNVEKAVLIFKTMPGGEVEKKDVKKNVQAGLGGLMPDVGTELADLSNAMQQAASMAGNALPDVVGSVGLNLNSLDDDEDLKFQVQFNPSTLNISARGGGSFQIANVTKKPDKDDKKGGTKSESSSYTYHQMDPYISIRFTLIFDQTNIADAFMADKFILNSQTIKNVMARNKAFTVRPIVEGFLAAVRNEKYRSVVFVWGSMRYGGMMREISTKYTMFSVSGEPIRAEVSVTLQLADTENTGNTEKGYVKEWQNKYDKIINKNQQDVMENGLEAASSIVTGNTTDSFKNLINL